MNSVSKGEKKNVEERGMKASRKRPAPLREGLIYMPGRSPVKGKTEANKRGGRQSDWRAEGKWKKVVGDGRV